MKKSIRKFLLLVFFIFIFLIFVWQGIFWIGEYQQYERYKNLVSKLGEETSFRDWAKNYSFLKMFVVGDILQFRNYQKYTAVQQSVGKTIISWEDWKKDVLRNNSAIEEWMTGIEKELEVEESDTYGGDTPEETWEMFLDALRDGDIELASKYFVLDKQAENLAWFQKVQEEGMLEEMIGDLTVSELDIVFDGYQRSEYIVGEKGEHASAAVILRKNLNNKWKLESI